MKRRALCVAALALAVAHLLGVRALAQTADSGERLNVLLVIVDDMRAETGSYGSPFPGLTPHLDAFARAENVTQFSHAFAQVPLCGPSRASFLTGRSPEKLKYYSHADDSKEPEAVLADKRTLSMPEWFARNGYVTEARSKIFHDPATSRQLFGAANFDDWGPTVSPDGCGGALVCPAADDADFVDTRAVAWAEQRIAQLARAPVQPWFLAVGLRRPHVPFRVPRRHLQRVQALEDQGDARLLGTTPASALLLPGPAVPPEAHSVCPGLDAYGDFARAADETLLVRRGYLAAVAFADEMVGRLLAAVDAAARDNTVVVVMSDHGFSLGERDAFCKRSVYDLVTRVPLWVRDPRQSLRLRGAASWFSAVDLFPTLADLAGVPLPAAQYAASALDGVSRAHEHFRVRPSARTEELLLRSASLRGVPGVGFPREAAFTLQPACFDSRTGEKLVCGHAPRYDRMGVSVRSGEFRYTEWRAFDERSGAADFLGAPLAAGKSELYHLARDPHEMANVAYSNAYAEVVATHAQMLRARYVVCDAFGSSDKAKCAAEAHCRVFPDGRCGAVSDCARLDAQPAVCAATLSICAVSADGARCESLVHVTGPPTPAPSAAPTPRPTQQPTTLFPTRAPTRKTDYPTRAPTEGLTLDVVPATDAPALERPRTEAPVPSAQVSVRHPASSGAARGVVFAFASVAACLGVTARSVNV